jgi:type II secretory pathway pseudopilin PulG
MTTLVDRLPLSLRARLSRGSTTRRSGAGSTLPCIRSGSLSRGYWSGLTLIEMLVAMAITLVMMAAVVTLFANMSESIRNRRAAIETGAQLRQVRNRLAMDLAGATCRGSTWQDPAENQGYIEIIEGRHSDKDPSDLILPANLNTNNGIDTSISLIPSSQAFNPDTGEAAGPTGPINIGVGAVTDGRALGDWDDILALTVRSESDPFVVRDDMGTPADPTDDVIVESPLAEVAWFAIEKRPSTPAAPDDGIRAIHRRVRLIAPWRGPWAAEPNNISAHWDPARNQWVANTLGDLSKRENRSKHAYAPGSFPHQLDRGQLVGSANENSRVLDSALAFDVRLFDPGAPLFQSGTTVLEPSDLGWDAAAAGTATGYGAYCDLGWSLQPNTTTPTYLYPAGATPANPLGTGTWPSVVPIPFFHIPRQVGWHPNVPASGFVGFPAVYDTWSYHYENDGIDQDNLLGADQGANGLDDDNANGVDDRGERETSPPYDVPLRGVKVILRVYEPDSRQIRESSVTHSFKQ